MNRYEQQLEEVEQARKLWRESERLLSILRTPSAKPLKQPTEQEILQWYQTNLKTSQSFAN